jgi:DNA-nicking Smr family endonuclease
LSERQHVSTTGVHGALRGGKGDVACLPHRCGTSSTTTLARPSLGTGAEHQAAEVADRQRTMAAMKLKLDLHDIYNRGGDIDRALRAIIDEAVAKKAPLVEIIPGKGSGALKKHVLRFLDQKEIKALYHRVEKDSNNFGRVFVHFRWK